MKNPELISHSHLAHYGRRAPAQTAIERRLFTQTFSERSRCLATRLAKGSEGSNAGTAYFVGNRKPRAVFGELNVDFETSVRVYIIHKYSRVRASPRPRLCVCVIFPDGDCYHISPISPAAVLVLLPWAASSITSWMTSWMTSCEHETQGERRNTVRANRQPQNQLQTLPGVSAFSYKENTSPKLGNLKLVF